MRDGIDINDIDLDKFIEELDADYERRKIKRENPYALDLMKVLLPFGERGLLRRHVIDRIWRIRNDTPGINMPDFFENTVQASFNAHNPASSCFGKQSMDQALFYPVGGKGSGRWAVDAERAKAWLKGKRLEIDKGDDQRS